MKNNDLRNKKAIRYACIMENPDIMMLKFGCIIRKKEGMDDLLYIESIGSLYRGYNIRTNHVETVNSSKVEVFGRELTLSDIMRLLDKRRIPGQAVSVLGTHGLFLEYNIVDKSMRRMGIEWDFEKSFDRQDKEVINTIYQLIK